MRPNVVLSASLFALSPLVLAIENAQPHAQVAPHARQYPSITLAAPPVRNPQALGYWQRQASGSDVLSETETLKSTTSSSDPPPPSSTSESSSTTTTTTTTTTPPPSSTSVSTPASTPRSSPPPQSLSAVVSTASDGGITTVFQTVTNSGTATSSSASASSTDASDDSGGVGTKSIAGIVVAGSLAVIGIGAFIWWKMSKKRFSGLEDTDDNFKWPDLNENTAMQPLPGRAESVRGGRDGALDSQSESTHAKPYYDNQSAISSAADLSRGPVEHAPSSLYYDHPPPQYPTYQQNPHPATSDAASGYYDPYSGPVPEVFSPQTATGPGFAADAGRRSPGPNSAYDASGYGPRAASPGPNAAYAPRSASPGPNVAYGGPRAASPGPNMAYGGPRAASPGPNAAYGPRSASPGPNAAYGPRSASPGPGAAYAAYGARSASPGPNYAYGGRTSPGPNNFGQH
ncbi:hypothetical protein FRC04_006561 [Tulasnella sp. 424]|nr:hypothetical protein FRC04_006561 [Tulasnella sp. 424]KAG8980981.1 hypothetical protein FRC05_003880 [Tulasnella sp. 425]